MADGALKPIFVFLDVESSPQLMIDAEGWPSEILEREILPPVDHHFWRLVTTPPRGPFFEVKSGRIELVAPSGLRFHIDLSKINYRRSFTPRKDLLCRACGWHLGLRSIWDLTAGLAVDATMLAQVGFNVMALEQNPYVYLLLFDAFKRQGKESISLRFRFGDAHQILLERKYEPSELPQVAYYDPMYPSKNKSALPSKELQILRELNGTDGEDPRIIEMALERGISRVVVKRPINAPVLLRSPSAQIKGKLIRFDIYLRKD